MNKKHWVSLLVCSVASVGLGYVVHAEGAPTTQPLFYSGTLEDDGALAEGDYTVRLTLHDAASAGAVVCMSETVAVPVVAGRFRMDVSDCADELQTEPDAWAAVQFTGSDGTPHAIPGRTKVGAVPYAMEAQHAVSATRLGTLAVADVQRKVVAAGCAAGSSIRVVNADGTVVCEADDDTTYAGSTGVSVSGGVVSLATATEYYTEYGQPPVTADGKIFCALGQVYHYVDTSQSNPNCIITKNGTSWTLSAQVEGGAPDAYFACKMFCI